MSAPDAVPGRRRLWRERALVWAPSLSLGLVVAMLWASLAGYAIQRPQEIRAEQQRDLAQAAHIAAAQTESLLRQAENALRVIDLWLRSSASPQPTGEPALAELARQLHISADRGIEVVLLTRDGRALPLRASPTAAGSDPRQQAELMASLALDGHSGVTLGLPLEFAVAGGAPSAQLPLALPLSRPIGEVDRVLALIDIGRLHELHRHFTPPGTEAALTLLRNDGRALSRVPELPGFVGKDVWAAHPERRALFAPPEGAFTTSGDQSDGQFRVGAFASLGDYGVKLLLSRTESAALAAHHQLVTRLSLAALLATAGLALIGWWLQRAQRAARLRDAVLQATSNAVSIGLFRTARDGHIVYVNEAYLKVHGLQREEIAWGWTRLVHPEHREALISTWKRHMASGEPIHMVRKMVRGDTGAIRMLEVHTAPLVVDGQVIGQAGTVEDVTERSEQENAVRTLADIFDMTPDYVCQIREDGELVYLNPAGRLRLGIALDAPLAGINIGRYYPRHRVSEYQNEILPTAIRVGHWQGRSSVQVRPDFELPIDTTVLVHRDRRGRLETISLLMRDVSESLRAQRERQRNEALLAAVAHTTSALISVIDTEQRLIFMNDAFAEHHGVTRAEWIGRPLAELLGAAAYGQRRSQLERALQGDNLRGELQAGAHRDTQSFELQTGPLRVEGGGIEGAICIELDVTEARREEARLRAASQTDALTQLLNRNGFEEGVRRLLAEAHGQHRQLALLCLDLDRFKPVNDTHGHPTGDALLKAVAQRLRHALRPSDLVARLGGDEFAVVLGQISRSGDAAIVADKLVHALATPFHIGELQLEIGVSVGLCVAPAESATLEALVAAADARLYEAKRAGRGCWRGGLLGDAPAASAH
jgi:diguanylate cyclase (GGDEF)-like protein/PAS domain S-box-containing protein